MKRGNERKFNKILEDIKSVKIQGARNIAKAALYAYHLNPSKSSERKLIKARETEPMLVNVLKKAEKENYNKIFAHFSEAQEKINKNVFRIIKTNDRIFTHCHSTNVVNALIYAKKKGKKFQAYNTETRPLFQGRRTARELRKAGIKVMMFIDSALNVAIEKENRDDKIYSNKIFLGADALLKNGIINKIGSNLIAKIAKMEKVSVYIIADSWKFSQKNVPIEQRKLNEVWNRAPKNIKIKNPSFEFVPKSNITKIISELGILSYGEFVRRMK